MSSQIITLLCLWQLLPFNKICDCGKKQIVRQMRPPAQAKYMADLDRQMGQRVLYFESDRLSIGFLPCWFSIWVIGQGLSHTYRLQDWYFAALKRQIFLDLTPAKCQRGRYVGRVKKENKEEKKLAKSGTLENPGVVRSCHKASENNKKMSPLTLHTYRHNLFSFIQIKIM